MKLSRGFTQHKYKEEWQIQELNEAIHAITGLDMESYAEKIRGFQKRDEIEEYVSYLIVDSFLDKKEAFDNEEQFFDIERQVSLRTIDRSWMDHINAMMMLCLRANRCDGAAALNNFSGEFRDQPFTKSRASRRSQD